MTLPEAELSFYFAAAAQLEPALRPAFTERVVTILQSHADPGPGDVNGVVRQAPADPGPGSVTVQSDKH